MYPEAVIIISLTHGMKTLNALFSTRACVRPAVWTDLCVSNRLIQYICLSTAEWYMLHKHHNIIHLLNNRVRWNGNWRHVRHFNSKNIYERNDCWMWDKRHSYIIRFLSIGKHHFTRIWTWSTLRYTHMLLSLIHNIVYSFQYRIRVQIRQETAIERY